MNPTTNRPSIETEVAGMILNALIPAAESCGFQVADHSVSADGLTLVRPDGPPIRVVFLAVDDQPETMAPIAGGSDQPYHPTDEDWRKYHRIFDEVDDHGDFPEALPGSGFPVRDRHSPDALANIRRILWDV
jgi:hypothetical protein